MSKFRGKSYQNISFAKQDSLCKIYIFSKGDLNIDVINKTKKSSLTIFFNNATPCSPEIMLTTCNIDCTFLRSIEQGYRDFF